MPSRARVVAWGEESSIEPLVAAGFEVVSVLSPAQALARVVRARQANAAAGTAIAAVSLNTHGAAIVIVAGTEVIHSRSFEWPLGTPFTGARRSSSTAICSCRSSRRNCSTRSPWYGRSTASPSPQSSPVGTCRDCARWRCSSSRRWTSRSKRWTRPICSMPACRPALASPPQHCSSLLPWHRPASNACVFTPSRQRHQRTASVTTAPRGCASASSPACSMLRLLRRSSFAPRGPFCR